MLLVSLISYLDRNTLALLAPTILKETHLSAREYGFIVSAFSALYTIGNVVWGIVLDRVGLRKGMLASVSFWSIASAAHAFAGGFWSFTFARAALGFGEGATFPGGLRAVTQTLRPAEQARGMAVAYSGGSLGAIVTPLIITPIALWWGWRAAFLFTGLVGAAWVAWWLFVSRRDDIREGTIHLNKKRAPVRAADPRTWSFVVIYGLGGLPLGFVMNLGALYLSQQLSVSQRTIGKLLWIPPLGWEVGYFFWGWLLDRMIAHGHERWSATRRLMFISVWLSLPLAAVPHIDSLWIIMPMLFFAMFVTVGFVIPSVQYAVHAFGRENSGLVGGLGAGAFGISVGIFMPVFGWLFDQKNYATAFALGAILPGIGFAVWSLANRKSLGIQELKPRGAAGPDAPGSTDRDHA
jgi:ACS family hexuronate transporter-like MFS transporter